MWLQEYFLCKHEIFFKVFVDLVLVFYINLKIPESLIILEEYLKLIIFFRVNEDKSLSLLLLDAIPHLHAQKIMSMCFLIILIKSLASVDLLDKELSLFNFKNLRVLVYSFIHIRYIDSCNVDIFEICLVKTFI